MKKSLLILLGIGLLFGFIFVGCSDDDDDDNNVFNPPTLAETPDYALTLPSNWETYLTPFDTIRIIEDAPVTVSSVRMSDVVLLVYEELQEFVADMDYTEDSTFLDCFSYVVVGSDSFSSHGSDYNNLTWSQVKTGYFDITDPEAPDAFYSVDMAGKYRIRGAAWLHMYRTITVNDPEETDVDVQYEVAAQTTELHSTDESVEENAIPLADMVNGYITETPENYSYTLEACDGFATNPLTYEELQQAYYHVDANKVYYSVDSLNTNRFKIKNLSRININ